MSFIEKRKPTRDKKFDSLKFHKELEQQQQQQKQQSQKQQQQQQQQQRLVVTTKMDETSRHRRRSWPPEIDAKEPTPGIFVPIDQVVV